MVRTDIGSSAPMTRGEGCRHAHATRRALPRSAREDRAAARVGVPPAPPAGLDRAPLRLARGVGDHAEQRLHAGLRLRAGVRGRLAPLREGGLGQGPADVRRLLPRGGAQARRPAGDRARPAPAVAPRRRLGGPRHRVRRRPRAAPAVAPAELDALLDALEQVADALTPPPADLALDTRGGRLRAAPRRLAGIRATRTDLDPPTWPRPRPWPGRYAEVVGGDTLVHTDIRSDNVHHRRRRPGPDLRLELAGARRRVVRLVGRPDRPARRGHRRRRGASPRDGCCATSTRRPSTSTSRSTSATSSTRASCRAADVAAPPRPPALAGRGLLGLAGRAPGLACDRTARGRRTPAVRRRPRRRARVGGRDAGLPRRRDRRAGGRHVAGLRHAA